MQTCWIMCLCLLLGTVSVSASPIPNGDFEGQDKNALAWWECHRLVPLRLLNNTHGSDNLIAQTIWDTASRGDGSGSLRFQSRGLQGVEKGGSLLIVSPADGVRVKPGTDCKLSWYWKGSGLSEKTALQVVVFCQSAGAEKAPSRFLQQFATSLTKDNPDWVQGVLSFKTPPETSWIQIRLAMQNTDDGKLANAWIDDFAIEAEGADANSPAPSAQWTPRGMPPVVDREGLGGFALAAPPQAYGSNVQRVMKLLATSTPERRNRVRIVFYGQSIIAQNWWKRIVADLRERYPYADIVASNPSIGGLMSDTLKDTMYANVYAANADLICFHDYARNASEIDEMLQKMRTLTTADIMVFTHHVSFVGNGGYQRAHDQESENLVKWSKQYGLEAVDIRSSWQAYLKAGNLKGGEFLRDVVHLNAAGEALWWKITMPHFQRTESQTPYWREWVKVFASDGTAFEPEAQREYPDQGEALTRPLKLQFKGDRVDILADTSASTSIGSARILIDGKPPSANPRTYFATVGSPPPNFFQPMLRRIEIGASPVVESWTLTFSKMSADGSDFEYEVRGSVTGEDGKGNARERFTSRSGRIVIDPAWFHVQALVKGPSKGVAYPDGTKCMFAVKANFIDVWKPTELNVPGTEKRYTLAAGLENGPHTLGIIPNDDGVLPVRAIVVHSPPAGASRQRDRRR